MVETTFFITVTFAIDSYMYSLQVHHIQQGQYRPDIEWGEIAGIGRLGAGAMGTCVLASDTSSRRSFCAKEVITDCIIQLQ